MELGTKEFNDSAMEMFGGKPKQQTAVEWYIKKIKEARQMGDDINMEMDIWHTLDVLIEKGEQAKEMEKQQQENFASWCIKKRVDFFDSTEIGETYTIDGFVSRYKMNELLEIYKKEKGL